jgi:hypothetical protein
MDISTFLQGLVRSNLDWTADLDQTSTILYHRGMATMFPDQAAPTDLKTCCEVRESPLGGNGLFATRRIQEGQCISLYPIHAYSQGEYWEMTEAGKVMWDEIRWKDYEQNAEFGGIVAFPQIQWPGFLAHISNDRGYKEGTKKKKYKSKARRNNAEIFGVDPYHFVLTASKLIEKDVEITNTYGWEYWKIKTQE